MAMGRKEERLSEMKRRRMGERKEKREERKRARGDRKRTGGGEEVGAEASRTNPQAWL